MPRKAATDLNATMVARLIREADETYRDVADGSCRGSPCGTHRAGSVWFRPVSGTAAPGSRAPRRREVIDPGAGAVGRHRRPPARRGRARHPGAGVDRAKARRPGIQGRRRGRGPGLHAARQGPATWTFGEARQAWCAWMRREVERGGLLRDATVRNYVGVMGGPAMRTLDASIVSRITAADVAAVVEVLVAEGKRSTARDVRPRLEAVLAVDGRRRPTPPLRRRPKPMAGAAGAEVREQAAEAVPAPARRRLHAGGGPARRPVDVRRRRHRAPHLYRAAPAVGRQGQGRRVRAVARARGMGHLVAGPP